MYLCFKISKLNFWRPKKKKKNWGKYIIIYFSTIGPAREWGRIFDPHCSQSRTLKAWIEISTQAKITLWYRPHQENGHVGTRDAANQEFLIFHRYVWCKFKRQLLPPPFSSPLIQTSCNNLLSFTVAAENRVSMFTASPPWFHVKHILNTASMCAQY